MKKLLSALLALLLVVSLAACTSNTPSNNNAPENTAAAEKDHLARIQEAGKLVVAMEGNWSPWTYHDETTDVLSGFDVELVLGLTFQTARGECGLGDGGSGAGSLVEAGIAVLDGPAVGGGVVVPTEGDTVGGHIADGEAGDVGAGGSGEGKCVAPVAWNEAGAAEGLDAGIVGDACCEAAKGDGMRSAEIGAIQCGAAPDMDVPPIPHEECQRRGSRPHRYLQGLQIALP